MHKRRKHPRVELKKENLPLLFVQDGKRRRIPLTATNLSRGGVGFLCTQQFDIDEELQAMIILPDATPISCSGTIRFKQEVWGLHSYGMELNTDLGSQNIIGQYLLTISHNV
jgi:hypothetical protein